MKDKLTAMIAQREILSSELRESVDRYNKAIEEMDCLHRVLCMLDTPVESKAIAVIPTPSLPTGTLSAASSGGEGRGEVAPKESTKPEKSKNQRGGTHRKGKIKSGSRLEKILAVLQGGSPAQATTEAIAKASGLTNKQVADCLCAPRSRKHITKVGRGIWSLKDSTAPSPKSHPSYPLAGQPSAIAIEINRVLENWKPGINFTRDELMREISPTILKESKPGAMADAMIKLRHSGRIGLVTDPTPDSPAVYKLA